MVLLLPPQFKACDDRNYIMTSSNPDINFYNKSTSFWDLYHQCRPTYPDELYEIIFNFHNTKNHKNNNSSHDLAIDYGTGPGTIIPHLLSHFQRVIGLDLNSDQIAMGKQLLQDRFGQDRVDMQVGTAGNCDWLESESADMIIAAEAVHWFDVESWTMETGRILKSGGTFACIYYSPYCVIIGASKKVEELLTSILHSCESYILKERESNGGSLLSPFSCDFYLLINTLGFFTVTNETFLQNRAALKHTAACTVMQLDNIRLDQDLFINEERHKWQHDGNRYEINGPELNMKTVSEDIDSKVGKQAKLVEHPITPLGPLLQSKGWNTIKLLEYLESLGIRSKQDIDGDEMIQKKVKDLERCFGGQDATFDVAWWCSLILATRR